MRNLFVMLVRGLNFGYLQMQVFCRLRLSGQIWGELITLHLCLQRRYFLFQPFYNHLHFLVRFLDIGDCHVLNPFGALCKFQRLHGLLHVFHLLWCCAHQSRFRVATQSIFQEVCQFRVTEINVLASVCQLLYAQTQHCQRKVNLFRLLQCLACCASFCNTFRPSKVDQMQPTLLFRAIGLGLNHLNDEDSVRPGAAVVLIGWCNLTGPLTNHQQVKDVFRTRDCDLSTSCDYDRPVFLLTQFEVLVATCILRK